MQVTFQLHFPIVNAVTGKHTWHRASVGLAGLDLTAKQVFKLLQDMLHIAGRDGGIGSMLYLAEQMRIVSVGTNEEGFRTVHDVPVATILWGRANDNGDIIDGTDVVIDVNFNDGRIHIDGNEYLLRSVYEHSGDFDWWAEITAAVDRAYARRLCR